MQTEDVAQLLALWERGAQASAARRGLLLLAAACPNVDAEALLKASIGRRDAWLLRLRRQWFGRRIDCLASCAACGQQIELNFLVDDICAASAGAGETCEVMSDAALQVRLPNSADLLAIEDCADAEDAVGRLAQTCRVDQSPQAAPLNPECLAAVSDAMGLADPQGDVTLEIACPACGNHREQPFDIVGHLWCEFDQWARHMLGSVHALAMHYGWSEQAILGMSAQRRQVYLQMLGAV